MVTKEKQLTEKLKLAVQLLRAVQNVLIAPTTIDHHIAGMEKTLGETWDKDTKTWSKL